VNNFSKHFWQKIRLIEIKCLSLYKLKRENMKGNVISARRAKAELKQQAKGFRADGMGVYTSAIFAVNAAGEYKALSTPEDVDASSISMFVIVG
jgi:hypothetical protein